MTWLEGLLGRGALSGVVLLDGAAPDCTVFVELMPAERFEEQQRVFIGPDDRHHIARNGTFRIRLRPGKYAVGATVIKSQQMQSQHVVGKHQFFPVATVEITQGASTELTINLNLPTS